MRCLESQPHKLNPPDCFNCVSGFYPPGYFQRCHQTKPLPCVSAPLLLECAAVGPHPLRAVLQRRVWSKGRVRGALVGIFSSPSPPTGMRSPWRQREAGWGWLSFVCSVVRERRVQKCKKDVLFFFVLFCFPPRLVWAFWEAYGLPAQEPPCVVILPATCCWLFWLLSAPQIQSFRSNKNIYWGPTLCQVLQIWVCITSFLLSNPSWHRGTEKHVRR